MVDKTVTNFKLAVSNLGSARAELRKATLRLEVTGIRLRRTMIECQVINLVTNKELQQMRADLLRSAEK